LAPSRPCWPSPTGSRSASGSSPSRGLSSNWCSTPAGSRAHRPISGW
jgi:hypothetical protein